MMTTTKTLTTGEQPNTESKNKKMTSAKKEESEKKKVGTTEPVACTKPASQHVHFAGRQPAGSKQPIAVAKNGTRLVRLLPSGETKETLTVGLACSECFSGARLAKLLKPGFEYEKKVLEDLMSGSFASPMSIHTSGGVPAALDGFIDALEPHLPWHGEKDGDDWCVSLQLEGASAVWAALDMLLQLQNLRGHGERKKVAVGRKSYHGPPSTSCGSNVPLWAKGYQELYPVPTPGENDHDMLLKEFATFLEKNKDEIGVMLVEPQWGSSQAAYPWPKDLLKKYVSMAHEYGILVCSDEIMCGLGRHGEGSLFLAKAWDLNVDAVTFGKAVAGGVFPLAGAVVKGAAALGTAGKTVIQSHTFAGSSVRAFMAATEVLKALPEWFESVANLGEEMGYIFRYLAAKSGGMLLAHGQGLMWGCLFDRSGILKDDVAVEATMACFRKHCEEVGVLPYFVPAGGFMVTPVMDIDVGTVFEIGQKLEEVIDRTLQELGWKPTKVVDNQREKNKSSPSKLERSPSFCTTQLHAAKTCTSCSKFVCQNVRMKFLCI